MTRTMEDLAPFQWEYVTVNTEAPKTRDQDKEILCMFRR